MEKGNPGNRVSTVVRTGAVRIVLENEAGDKSRSQAIALISERFGCSRDTAHGWINKQAVEDGTRDYLTQSKWDEIKALQCENRELKQLTIRGRVSAVR